MFSIVDVRTCLCRTEQRGKLIRKIYTTARILNQVIDALLKQNEKYEDFDPEVNLRKALRFEGKPDAHATIYILSGKQTFE